MIYDGEGDVIEWFMITQASILTINILEQFGIAVMLVESDDGKLNSKILLEAMMEIRR